MKRSEEKWREVMTCDVSPVAMFYFLFWWKQIKGDSGGGGSSIGSVPRRAITEGMGTLLRRSIIFNNLHRIYFPGRKKCLVLQIDSWWEWFRKLKLQKFTTLPLFQHTLKNGYDEYNTCMEGPWWSSDKNQKNLNFLLIFP